MFDTGYHPDISWQRRVQDTVWCSVLSRVNKDWSSLDMVIIEIFTSFHQNPQGSNDIISKVSPKKCRIRTYHQ